MKAICLVFSVGSWVCKSLEACQAIYRVLGLICLTLVKGEAMTALHSKCVMFGLVLSLIAVGEVRAQLVNGDFSDGLTGWSYSGQVGSSGQVSVDIVSPGTGGSAGGTSELWQTFAAQARDVLTVSSTFSASVESVGSYGINPGHGEYLFSLILNPSQGEPDLMLDGSNPDYFEDSLVIPQTGTYTLMIYGNAQAFDGAEWQDGPDAPKMWTPCSVDSQVTATFGYTSVPEPSTFVLLSIALGPLAWSFRLRMRRKRLARRPVNSTVLNQLNSHEANPAILSLSSHWTESARPAA